MPPAARASLQSPAAPDCTSSVIAACSGSLGGPHPADVLGFDPLEELQERLAVAELAARDVEVLVHLDSVAAGLDGPAGRGSFTLDFGRGRPLVPLMVGLPDVDEGDAHAV
jgi:hypothetical protein